MDRTMIIALVEMRRTFSRETSEVLSLISSSGSLDELHQNVSHAMGILTCFADMVDTLNKVTGYSILEASMDAARAEYRHALDEVNAAQATWMDNNAPWNEEVKA